MPHSQKTRELTFEYDDATKTFDIIGQGAKYLGEGGFVRLSSEHDGIFTSEYFQHNRVQFYFELIVREPRNIKTTFKRV